MLIYLNDFRLTVVGVALVFLLSGLLVLDASTQPTLNIEDGLSNSMNKLSPHLTITVNGVVVVDKEDDLVVTNGLKVLQGFFTDPSGSSAFMTITDSSNVARNFGFYGKASQYVGYISSTSGATPLGGMIGIGTSSSAASTSQVGLGSLQLIGGVQSSTYSGGNITIVNTFDISSSLALKEVGLFLRLHSTTGDANIMFARDTYTTVNVVSGDTVVVTYVLNLNNTAFTDNFGQFFENLFGYHSSTSSFFMQDISGSDRLFVIYSTYSAGINNCNFGAYVTISCTTDGGSGHPASFMQLGGDNTTVSRSDYNLGEDLSAVLLSGGYKHNGVSITGASNNNLTIAGGLFVFTGSDTVNEVGFFMTWFDEFGVERDIMLVHLNTVATAKTSGQTSVPYVTIES